MLKAQSLHSDPNTHELEHLSIENIYSLALFYLFGEYLGTGALVSLKYVLTVPGITIRFETIPNQVDVHLGISNHIDHTVLKGNKVKYISGTRRIHLVEVSCINTQYFINQL